MEVGPVLVLTTWTAGMAAGAALVAAWRVVGAGFLRLVGAAVLLFGGLAVGLGAGPGAIVGVLAALAGAAVARRNSAAVVLLGISAAAFLVVGAARSPIVPLLSGAVLLGAVTTEMSLGHWYLVDPRLPRWPLRAFDAIAGGGLVLDVVWAVVAGPPPLSGPDGVLGMAWGIMAAFTGLLLLGVWFSLSEPRYSGVMAATGLSYLAVLTTFGVVTVARVLVA